MVQEVPARTKIPTRSPATGPRRCGITVYPAREEQGRWRAVWYENGQRRQCEAASEDKLAACGVPELGHWP